MEKNTKKEKKENGVLKAIKKAVGTIVLGLKYVCIGTGAIILATVLGVSIDAARNPDKYKIDETEE